MPYISKALDDVRSGTEVLVGAGTAQKIFFGVVPRRLIPLVGTGLGPEALGGMGLEPKVLVNTVPPRPEALLGSSLGPEFSVTPLSHLTTTLLFLSSIVVSLL